MPMRKHIKTRNYNRPIPWPNPPKQFVATLDAYSKLLGIKVGVESIIADIETANKRYLRKFEVAAEPMVKTAADKERLLQADARRLRQGITRTVSYARCIRGNWNKTLTENVYRASVNISRTLEVDKAFVQKFA